MNFLSSLHKLVAFIFVCISIKSPISLLTSEFEQFLLNLVVSYLLLACHCCEFLLKTGLMGNFLTVRQLFFFLGL